MQNSTHRKGCTVTGIRCVLTTNAGFQGLWLKAQLLLLATDTVANLYIKGQLHKMHGGLRNQHIKGGQKYRRTTTTSCSCASIHCRLRSICPPNTIFRCGTFVWRHLRGTGQLIFFIKKNHKVGHCARIGCTIRECACKWVCFVVVMQYKKRPAIFSPML